MTVAPHDAGVESPAETIETHISIVFFLGDRAYKLKKPVEFPFADLRTREAREHLCHREVELNRRLAPDVYFGVADVTGPDGAPCDHLVAMRRMPTDRRLSALVEAGDDRVPGALADLGRQLARFHRAAARSPVIDAAASRDRIGQRWHDNFDEMQPFVGDVLDPDTFDQAILLADDYLAGRGPLFAERIAAGNICDGHGDLQADDVFCLDDGPRALDCIEFCDEFRYGDVAEDLAFLAMDLERLGAPALVEDLLDAYEHEVGAMVPRPLLRFYVGYRAQVRAKVACLRTAQLPADDPRQAQARSLASELLELCRRALGEALPRLVVVGGLPGTGKTTVATGIARTLGIEVIRSDVVRKTLAGIDVSTPAAAPFGQGLYDPQMTDCVYAELMTRASAELGAGRSVVLDASFTADGHRQQARALAAETRSALVELRCAVSDPVAAQRIQARRRRGTDASDADPEIAAAMRCAACPWPESTALPTAEPAHQVLAHALRHILRAPSPGRAPATNG